MEAFAFYRGRVDGNQINARELLYASSLPDRTGILLNMIQVGAAYDDVLTDAHHKGRDGISAEVSAEWGPGFFFNTLFGDSDYLRFNGSFTWFLPLFDAAPDRPVNLFNVYLAEYLSVDYAVGLAAPVPLVVRQTFGGRNQLDGLGGQVRGVDSDSLDTNLKAVNNLEIRLPTSAHCAFRYCSRPGGILGLRFLRPGGGGRHILPRIRVRRLGRCRRVPGFPRPWNGRSLRDVPAGM